MIVVKYKRIQVCTLCGHSRRIRPDEEDGIIQQIYRSEDHTARVLCGRGYNRDPLTACRGDIIIHGEIIEHE